MKYIKQKAVCIKPIEFFGNTYYQIGADDWNIVIGLGGLVEIANQANKIIKERSTSCYRNTRACYRPYKSQNFKNGRCKNVSS